MVADPVCGKRINRGKSHIVIEHEGMAYLRCCPLCQSEFKRAPAAAALTLQSKTLKVD